AHNTGRSYQAAPESGLLPQQLRIRHIRPYPVSVKYMGIDAIADFQQTSLTTHDTRQPQQSHERVRFVVWHALTTRDLRIQVEQAGAIDLAFEEAFPCKQEVVVAFAGAGGEKQVVTEPVYIRRGLDRRVGGNSLTEPLGQIGMSMRPEKNARQKQACQFR